MVDLPYVRLIAATAPVFETQDGQPAMSTDEFVAYVARVSNPANQDKHATAPRLLQYLREHQHWSPFEMAHAVLEIRTTRDIARQMLRHRSFSFQEFSQRYSSDVEFAEPRDARLQDRTNRQNSIETDDGSLLRDWYVMQGHISDMSKNAYDWALDHGIAKEVARSVLPEGLTVSRLYMTGSLRSWFHYTELRTGPETQKEHRLVAEACRAVLVDAFPLIFGALSP